MRIVGGRARGVTLTTAGAAGLRPTTDRVRGAIFSMLEARQAVTGARGLDLYAGSGALGIEALSRGAARVDFVERNARLNAVIRQNLSQTRFEEQGRVLTMPVERALGALSDEPYDLILMDPPYAESASLEAVIQGLLDAGKVAPEATMVIEQSSREVHDFSRPGLRSIQEKRYGDTAVSLYQFSDDEDETA